MPFPARQASHSARSARRRNDPRSKEGAIVYDQKGGFVEAITGYSPSNGPPLC